MWKPKKKKKNPTKNEYIHAARSGSDVTTCHLNSIRGISKRGDVCARRYITAALQQPGWLERRLRVMRCQSALTMLQM